MSGKHSTFISEHSVPTFCIIKSPNTKHYPPLHHPAPYPTCQLSFQLLPIVTLLPVLCSSLLVCQFDVKHSAVSPIAAWSLCSILITCPFSAFCHLRFNITTAIMKPECTCYSELLTLDFCHTRYTKLVKFSHPPHQIQNFYPLHLLPKAQLKLLHKESYFLSKISLCISLRTMPCCPHNPRSPCCPGTYACPKIFQVATHTQELSKNTSSPYDPCQTIHDSGKEIQLKNKIKQNIWK
jgi:hypothetical protein